MYGDKLKIDLSKYSVYINSSHVCIREKDTVVYQRETPFADNWYDESHTRIVKAIQELEQALCDAVGK